MRKAYISLQHYFQLESPTHTILFFLSVVLPFVFLFLTPPFQKPDEPQHFNKTVAVSRGDFICQIDENGQFYNMIPSSIFMFPSDVFTHQVNHGAKFSVTHLWHIFTTYDETSSKNPEHKDTNSCTLPFFFYIPTAFFIALSNLITTNPVVLFYIGRVVNTFISILFFLLALRIIPKKYNLILLFIFSIPVVPFMLSSYNKDVFHITLGMLLFSLILALRERSRCIEIKREAFFLISIVVLFILSRPQYLFIALVFFLIPFNKSFKINLIYQLFFSAMTFSIALLFIFFLITQTMYVNPSPATITSSQYFIFPDVQFQLLIEYPLRIITVMNNTFQDSFLNLVHQVLIFRGYYGMELSYSIVVAYAILCFAVFARIKHIYKTFTIFELSIITLMIVLITFSISGAMYLYGSSVGSLTVDNLQGRYFVVLIPFFFLFIASVRLHISKITTLFIGIIIVSIIAWGVADRYYNYRAFYDRKDPSRVEISKEIQSNPFMKVDKPVNTKIWIEKTRFLAGFQFFIDETVVHQSKPYILRVLDKDCKEELRVMILDMYRLTPEHANDIVFRPIPKENSYVCVQLEPQVSRESKGNYMHIATTEKNKPYFKPIYLH